MKRVMAAVFVLLAAFAPSAAQSRPAADLIITHAKVWTVDPQRPQAASVAVLGERIVAVGSDAAVGAWRGPKTRIIDAQGRRLLPGFNDSHVHFVSGGLQLDQVDLRDSASPHEFAARIQKQGAKTAKGAWVLGGDWDEQRWPTPALPSKELIDPGTPNTPVAVSRYDGHMVLANSLALKLAGITAATPEPAGGVIVRDAQGNPTGILKDAAQDILFRAVPPLPHDERLRAVRRAMAHAASLGVTSVQNMSAEFADVAAYSELAERGELTVRIYAAPLETHWQDVARVGLRRSWGSSWLRMGALKGFADGSLGSATAYMFEPFAEDPGNRGILSDEMQPLEKMRERLTGADAAGLQICIHAIGDRGISMVLDLYEDVVRANGERDRRFRIEHAQHMAPADFDRFARLHVIASVQPYHAIDDGRWAEKRLGHERSKTTYAFRTFLNHGVRLAFGTDWNVAPLDPMLSLYAAVTRATLDGKQPGGWIPEEKITLAEAVEAYTMGSAYAEFQEREKGSITPGKLADMVLLSDDIFAIAPGKIREVKVVMTLVGGKIVYQAPQK